MRVNGYFRGGAGFLLSRYGFRVRENMSKKELVDALEFRGGYALVTESALDAIITGYRDGHINKDSIRVFAARAEKSSLHAKSKVDLSRILNCKASLEGVKRLRCGIIEKAGGRVDNALIAAPGGSQRRKSASRKALRAIAQGRLSCTESVVLLMYFRKRITQVKTMKRLESRERYARFTYRELETLSGISRANISRAVASLKRKGFLATVWVVKPNENEFGLLFVDGPALTLIKTAPKNRENPPVNEKASPPAQSSNSPLNEKAILIKLYPKSEIQERKQGFFPQEFDSDWDRIRARAKQIKESLEEQAA